MSAHPIDPFLDVWAVHGGRDGVDLRLRVYRALAALDAPADVASLRDALRAVLVWDERDRDRFERVFPEFFRGSLAAVPLEGLDVDGLLADLRAQRANPQRDAEEPVVVVEPRHVPSHRSIAPPADAMARAAPSRAGVHLVLDLLTVGFIVVLWAQGQEASRAFVPPTGRAADARAGADAALQQAPLAPPGSNPGPTPAVADPPAGRAAPATLPRQSSQVPWWLTFAFALAGTVALADALEKWRELRPKVLPALPPPPDVTAATLEEAEPDYRWPAPALPFRAYDHDLLAHATGFASEPDPYVLDLERTVHASARNLGILSPVYRTRKAAGTLVMAVPTRVDTVTAVILHDLAHALRERRVPVQFARGSECPHTADIALVFLDARNPFDPPLSRWWRHPRVAVVEVRDPWLWGPEVEELAVDGEPVQVFAPTLDGIRRALLAASRGLRGAASKRERHDPDTDDLGAAFPLAAACALCEPCDLATVDALRSRFTPELPFVALQRVMALDGVIADRAGWTFSLDLREHLVGSVGDSFRSDVLAWQSERLERLTAPAGSRAAWVIERERSLNELQRLLLDGTAREDRVRRLERVVTALEYHAAHEGLRRRLHERVRELSVRIPDTLTGDEVVQGRAARTLQGQVFEPRAPTPEARRAFWLEGVCAGVCLGCAVASAWMRA